MATVISNKRLPIINKSGHTSKLTRYYRIGRVTAHTFVAVLAVSAIFPVASKRVKSTLTKWWCRRLLTTLNMSITTHGHSPLPNSNMCSTMVVANHISWTDIHALNSIEPLRFIAKSEISHWPVFGYLARKANVLFIDRNKRHDAGRIVHKTAKSLEEGDNLCLFPEGTTTDGTKLVPFKSSIIQAAIHAKATIQPVAIRYPTADGNINTHIAYAGDTTMKESMQQLLMQKNPTVELHFLAPIDLANIDEAFLDRRKLTQHIEQLIKEKLDF